MEHTSSNKKSKQPEENLGALTPLVDAIAARVVAHIRPLLESAERSDDYVDANSAGVSKRWFDRSKGKLFPLVKNGRKHLARRSDVLRALERDTRFAPKPHDADEADLATAGIQLGGGAR